MDQRRGSKKAVTSWETTRVEWVYLDHRRAGKRTTLHLACGHTKHQKGSERIREYAFCEECSHA